MEHIINFLPNLPHLGVWGYWAIFAIALLESLAFVGTLIPGTIFIVLAGFLAARGFFDFEDLMIFVATGAILGDSISYYLGTKGTTFFNEQNKIFKISHLDQGKDFFEKHGNKSIFLGRFVGIIRPLMPFIAGLSGMRVRKFLFWDILSGLLWTASHLALGYFFGGSLNLIEVWTNRIGYFIMVLFFISAFIWVLVWQGRPLVNFIKSILVNIFNSIAANDKVKKIVAKHPKTFSFLGDRFNTNVFTGLPLTVIAVFFIYAFFLFAGVVEDIVVSNQLVQADISITNLLIGFRSFELVKIFTWITMLGKGTIIISLGVVITLILILWQRTKFILPLWVVLASSGLLTYIGKVGFHRPRPWQAVYTEKYFSFPSGHAALSVALYGFIAYLIFRNFKKLSIKMNGLFVAIVIILLVGFSRLYLGVHYFSDVWGGYLVGIMCLLVGIAISEWEIKKGNGRLANFVENTFTIYHKKIITFIFVIVESSFFISMAAIYNPVLNTVSPKNTSPVSQEKIIDYFQEKNISRYTESLIGNQQEPLNFIFVAKNVDEIKKIFATAGWNLADQTTPASFLKKIGAEIFNKNYKNAPMAAVFWSNEPNSFGLEKAVGKNNRQRRSLRFWQTNLVATDNNYIFVAAASLDVGIKWPFAHKISPNIDKEKENVLLDLKTTGLIENIKQIDFVKPISEKKQSGKLFFTDGRLYEIILK